MSVPRNDHNTLHGNCVRYIPETCCPMCPFRNTVCAYLASKGSSRYRLEVLRILPDLFELYGFDSLDAVLTHKWEKENILDLFDFAASDVRHLLNHAVRDRLLR